MRFTALLFLSLAAALTVAVGPAFGKEEVQATLTSAVPLEAAPGTEITLAWKLVQEDDEGRRIPFGAGGVFVRLIGEPGAPAQEGFAPVGDGTDGTYQASVRVPQGGITDIELGLQGTTSGDAGVQRSDLLFPITNEPAVTIRRVGAANGPGEDGSDLWPAIVGGGIFAALTMILVWTLVIRRRPNRPGARPTTPNPTKLR